MRFKFDNDDPNQLTSLLAQLSCSVLIMAFLVDLPLPISQLILTGSSSYWYPQLVRNRENKGDRYRTCLHKNIDIALYITTMPDCLVANDSHVRIALRMNLAAPYRIRALSRQVALTLPMFLDLSR